eukprot:scaffold1823_cov38-Cyclotella_meneghiniana.AAC.8
MHVMIHSKFPSSRILNSFSSLPSVRAVLKPPNVTSPKSLVSLQILHNVRTFSAAKGLFNTKKICRQPKHLITDDDRRKILQSTTGERKNEYSDKFLKGEVLDYSINLRTSRPGTEINVPYELTLTESLSDFWQSSFHSQDRVHTSTPFARALGLQDRVMPFSLVLFLTSAMSHEDAAKVQVGFGKCVYSWPVFAGDTVRKTFKVKSIRNTSDGNHSIFNFSCNLINQRGRVCMTADKRLLFEFPVPESKVTLPPDEPTQLFRDHLLSKAHVLTESQSLTGLHRGSLILHTLNRSITFAQSQQLASLARLTHERHFDIRKYDKKTEIYVPAGK